MLSFSEISGNGVSQTEEKDTFHQRLLEPSIQCYLCYFQKVRRFTYKIIVGRIIALNDVHVLILRTYEYIRLHGKRDSVDVIKLRLKIRLS